MIAVIGFNVTKIVVYVAVLLFKTQFNRKNASPPATIPK